MAQYDLVVPQNIAASGVEFQERFINIKKGGLLSAKADGMPVVLAKGTDDYMLVADSTTESGLKWQQIPAGHTQNTDIGTTSDTFQLQIGAGPSDEGGVILKSDDSSSQDSTSGYDLELLDPGGGVDGDGYPKTANLVVNSIHIKGRARQLLPPYDGWDLTNKTYVDNLVGALDGALVYKGTIGSGGTVTALPTTHGVGWTYRVITAATYAGQTCEIGDLITSIVARTGNGNQNADWTVAQANIDGAVVGPAESITTELLASWDSNNRKLKSTGVNPSNLILKTMFSEHSMLIGNGVGSATTMVVSASQLVGRKATGAIQGLSETDVRAILGYAKWVDAPLTNTSSGTKGTIAEDGNYVYVCLATDKWGRIPIATNWANPVPPEG
jgi:hypothetical protein